MSTAVPPATVSPRFILELEFVLCLSNPYYLQHLATVYPHLFISSTTTSSTETDAAKFAAYLKYLYAYWKTPQYAKFLTHPAAVLNTLKLLQEEQFRRDVIRPDVVDALLRIGMRAEDAKDGVELEGQGADLMGQQTAQAVHDSNENRMDAGV